MLKKLFSDNWYFSHEGEEHKIIDLPHDYSVTLPRNPHAVCGERTGFFTGGKGEYIKYFNSENEHIFLDIDGANADTCVYLNEDKVGFHPHGYTPCLIDITENCHSDSVNKLVITTYNRQPSSRWYAGAGIYRDVFLWTGGNVRVEPRDLFIYTENLKKNCAEMVMEVTVTADIDTEAEFSFSSETAEIKEKLTLHKGKNFFRKNFMINNPKLWNLENPYLYSSLLTIKVDGKITDETKLDFGVRKFTMSVEEGLKLNGETVKLKGGCIHHDHGVLGAAAFPCAEKRKVLKLKEAGFNAIRISHNPPSTAMMEICDREGIILMDEAFDMWNHYKTFQDYSLYFDDRWKRDLSYMVLRDRIHPCIFSYSTGNEIIERIGISDSPRIQREMTDLIRSLDSTRPVTNTVCPYTYRPSSLDLKENYHSKLADKTVAELTEKFVEPLDFVGYNYLWQNYEEDHGKYPHRIIWGSETHALTFYDSWQKVIEHPYVLGDFTWTAWDNLGEVGTGRSVWSKEGMLKGLCMADYPYRTCYQGDFDLCGFRRPQSYFRESIWSVSALPKAFTTHPSHNGDTLTGTGWHWYDVSDNWNFDEKYIGTPVKTDVYSTADEIEFELNGKILGRVKPVKAIATTDIPYSPGVLVTRSYKDGKLLSEDRLSTVGKPERIKIIPECDFLLSDNRDLCYLDIEICDKDGNRNPNCDNILSCTVDGGELMGVFSGNPNNEDEYGTNSCHAFYGRAVAIVRTKNAGKIKVTVSSPSMENGYCEIDVK